MLKDIITQKPPVHTRDIRLSTCEHGPDRIIVHGELRDERRLPIVDILSRPKPPGTVHHMTATLLIAPDPLRIIEAEAEIITAPMAECPQTLDRMDLIIGLHIKPGFSKEIRSRVGGKDGCAHLCTLVKAMGTEILHGWLTWQRHQNQTASRGVDPEKAGAYLIDSCRLWKKDGPKYKEMMSAVSKQANSE
ncbi:MAG: DUF2889 domain-containing protein [Desulfobacterales bacterium]|nr:DUF2889 domain-containing protein [Desulfobacterales bacterium]